MKKFYQKGNKGSPGSKSLYIPIDVLQLRCKRIKCIFNPFINESHTHFSGMRIFYFAFSPSNKTHIPFPSPLSSEFNIKRFPPKPLSLFQWWRNIHTITSTLEFQKKWNTKLYNIVNCQFNKTWRRNKSDMYAFYIVLTHGIILTVWRQTELFSVVASY